ncbi:chemotaxis protein CheB [Dokdonella sp.]|uniref:chemotaxis protein CheB n=1 Tax=Dokdonella sp. TaxID=2291710 RepID=UPI0025C5AD9E|nr:chemotaxis protein CheB [Dokdonella sp.]MBX3689874.1 hypothetical protein [Dokdonella sp.]
MNVPESNPIHVALLSDKPTRNEHLRAALDALGAQVAYESVASTFSREALERSGARVVIVNLDDGDNAEFDEVYDLLDDERYRVLINDGGVSCALSGWDQARWMRHLASKVFGNGEIHPPRPEGAEAIPVPVAATPPAEVVVEAPVPAPAASLQDAEPVPAPPREIELAAFDEPAPSLESTAIDQPDASTESIDVESLLDEPAPPAPEPAQESAVLQNDDAFAFDFDDLDAAPPPLDPVSEVPSAGLSLVDADMAERIEPIELESAEAAGDFGVEELTLEDSIPTSREVLEPRLEPAPEAEPIAADDTIAMDIDLDFDAPPPPVELLAPGEAVSSTGDASQWSIDELLDEVLADAPPIKADAEVHVDKMTAAEYLAPEGGEAPPASTTADNSLFSLELVPLEEVVAPVAIEKASHENWLDPDSAPAGKIRRVWVLGASIGGPDAVRKFLAGLPRGYPALFLVAQHLGDEFVETMTRQLARAVPLIVRTPAHGDRASHGEVLIVPNEQRLLVDLNGVVVLQPQSEPQAYRPSIDRVLEDVASRFGAGAGAIIFSGMSDDAAEGCKAIAAAGGRVYAQSPDSCVVSTMVEGVIDTGVVQFQGSPEELAQKLNDEPA